MDKGRGHNVVAAVNEDLKISVEKALQLFLADDDKKEYAFPSSLTSEERKYIHNFAPKHGLITKSRGTRDNRFLTVYKQEGASLATKEATFSLHNSSVQMLMRLLVPNPVSDREKKELMPQDPSVSRKLDRRDQMRGEMFCTTGRLNSIVPQVPSPIDYSRISDEILETRQGLPISRYRDTILQMIDSNNIVLIRGDTGCGKTTQVPQLILEECAQKGSPCRIIVTEPRRLSALSVADRVAHERGETVGHVIGYQIRLESKVSLKTLCTFCTNGVLLRTIMGGDNSLQQVTHIIVDEIHERDRFCDLLMTILRQAVNEKGCRFKLILMSATLNTQKFIDYFGGCPVIEIPGRPFDVKPFFLEDVLKVTGYKAGTMDEHIKRNTKSKVNQQAKLLGWCPPVEGHGKKDMDSDLGVEIEKESSVKVETVAIHYDMSDELKKSVEELLKMGWIEPSQQTFQDLLSLYINENVPIDYAHPETGVTALHVAVCRGEIDFVEAFLSLGANVSIRTPLNDFNAIEWAKHLNFPEIADLLSLYVNENQEEHEKEADEVFQTKALSDEDKKLLETYHRTFNDDAVDLKLIVMLLHYIFETGSEEPKGGILVFLPGYDEIVTLRGLICQEFDAYKYKYVLFTLHSQMQSSDHRKVFRSVPSDTRKIILSTNIAETSITIDDVMYVIDSGKVKEKAYDTLVGVTTMQSVWVSQSNAVQRRGRAGRCRPGVCYHLFSSLRFQNLEKFPVPEIMRMPAHELCLQVKLLVPNAPLNEFISLLPDPPSTSSIRSSISLLKAIDAFDGHENLTELGLLLLDLPIEPHLGKVVLHAVVLKCLDPILTIVCSITYKDPFLIPSYPLLKEKANTAKMKLSSGCYSDHMVLLKAFQGWQRAKNDGFEKKYCDDYFISSSTMEMILGLRTQLLGQLRASGFVKAKGPGDIRDLNTHSENWAVVKAALTAGYFPNIIRVERGNAFKQKLMSRKESLVMFHPSSSLSMACQRGKCLNDLSSDWLIYEEMSRIGRNSFARLCTLVSPLTLVVFCGAARLPSDAFARDSHHTSDDSEDEDEGSDRKKGSVVIKIDDWVSFRLNPDVGKMIWDLRIKWQTLFLRRISNPQKQSQPSDSSIVKTIAEVLAREEMVMGIPQPVGVGQRPIPMNSSYCSPVASGSSGYNVLQSPNSGHSSYGQQNWRRSAGQHEQKNWRSNSGRSRPQYNNRQHYPPGSESQRRF